METLNYILKKFNITYDDKTRQPIEIPNFGRDQLAELFSELNFIVGAEVGVESGEYSETLLSRNPNLLLFSIDAWKAHRGYRDHVRQEKFEIFYQNTLKRLERYKERSIIVRKYSNEAVKEISDNSLDFVYIDANHRLLNVVEDITLWLPKVKVGGIIAGHDYAKYGDNTQIHVVQATQAFTDAYHIRPWFVLGRTGKIPGEIRDENRSWMWVKIK